MTGHEGRVVVCINFPYHTEKEEEQEEEETNNPINSRQLHSRVRSQIDMDTKEIPNIFDLPRVEASRSPRFPQA